MTKKYVVYRHTSPEGKVYIGITAQAKPEYRWGPDGSGYKSNAMFWYDIQRLGWNNFKHEILYENLPEHHALHIESALIHEHHATKPEYGYNQDAGHLYPEEDSSLLKLKRHFAGKDAWRERGRTGDMKFAMKMALRGMKKR